ncbi:MAG: DNA-binding protein, partial [Aurantimicrobium sp.]
MPRPSKFDDSQILEAAAQLANEGRAVTGYAISVQLGGGRPSSLLERYTELTANVEKPAELPALPSDLAATIEKAAEGVMHQLTTAMTEAHASLKAQAHARIDEVEAELAQARKLHATELDDAADHLAAMQERAEVAEAATAAAQAEIQTLKEAQSKAEGELKAAGA